MPSSTIAGLPKAGVSRKVSSEENVVTEHEEKSNQGNEIEGKIIEGMFDIPISSENKENTVALEEGETADIHDEYQEKALMISEAQDTSGDDLRCEVLIEEFNDDMLRSAHLESDLRTSCTNLEASLSDLGRRLSDSVALLRPLGSDGFERSEQILGDELPALAKEVTRVETVRAYAGE
ncbi:uncharacterized protein A4U43_C09F2790 [Asparagus officinalis]|uniref:Uncharacterized protein n=1 Tax=Asparagus officinalis TaxID=4686 RepID=A0A5P1E4T2_ASPOF|nr:uncharacterized protein A4U43_C09F2790 [Asparagus officinalis]